jgi:hypothetical protein
LPFVIAALDVHCVSAGKRDGQPIVLTITGRVRLFVSFVSRQHRVWLGDAAL